MSDIASENILLLIGNNGTNRKFIHQYSKKLMDNQNQTQQSSKYEIWRNLN